MHHAYITEHFRTSTIQILLRNFFFLPCNERRYLNKQFKKDITQLKTHFQIIPPTTHTVILIIFCSTVCDLPIYFYAMHTI